MLSAFTFLWTQVGKLCRDYPGYGIISIWLFHVRRLVTHHSSTYVPVDGLYAAIVGKAVYVFAYYEWMIINVIGYLHSGFVKECSHGDSMTSDKVRQELQTPINSPHMSFTKVLQAEPQACCDEFIHAHPITDSDGSQILSYQTKITKPLPDMKLPRPEVEAIIQEFDAAACCTGALLDHLR